MMDDGDETVMIFILWFVVRILWMIMLMNDDMI